MGKSDGIESVGLERSSTNPVLGTILARFAREVTSIR
jgi:hypothetical protein